MKVENLYNLLKKNNIANYCGVPDSLMKDLCAYLNDNASPKTHTITANEGNAIAMAAGHYLATGNPSVVYLQNSGLGICTNPVVSLIDETLYSIPMLLLVGWRGEPGVKDEPQHTKQGQITCEMLDLMGIKYEILSKLDEESESIINKALAYMKETNRPFALVVQKGIFNKYEPVNKYKNEYALSREEAINSIVKTLSAKDVVVSSTGYITRELYTVREELNLSHEQDFLSVGSMGHASSIALGIALEKPNRTVYCFDGDGAFLMHQGAATVIAAKGLKNYRHIIFNNEAHDSVGAQPTVNSNIKLKELAKTLGYTNAYSVSTKEELENVLKEFNQTEGTSLLEIKVKCGARKDLGRPTDTPDSRKKIFMEFLKND